MMLSSNNTKKRRVGVSGGGDDTLPLLADGENDNRLVHEELKTISSHMTNMMQMMSSMQGEITRLTEKCDRMEKSIDTMQRTQIANHNTTNQMKQTINAMQTTQTTNSQNTNSRFDVMDNKLNYHEVLLKNQQWKYSAPRPSEEYWESAEDDVAVDAEDFLTQIKLKTEEMRYVHPMETLSLVSIFYTMRSSCLTGKSLLMLLSNTKFVSNVYPKIL